MNPAYGASFYVYLGEDHDEAPKLTVHDITGEQLAELSVKGHRGVQRVQWGARAGNSQAKPGRYSVRLHLPGEDEPHQVRAFSLHPDPMTTDTSGPSADPTTHPIYRSQTRQGR